MGLAAALSALGLLLTRLCTNSRLVYGMSLIRQVSYKHIVVPSQSRMFASLCYR
jgi:hypothetical protein